MGYIWKPFKFNTVILSLAIGVYPFSSLTPLSAGSHSLDSRKVSRNNEAL